ncbi:MAG: pimeloyl-CoA dehydrogenase large subunit [Alphaproteobacteria bacterium]|nr:pimeloyl-CoA dehydrogenase large subunit [Alphaproteobacteria bacterium]
MELEFTPEELAFREEVRAFFQANLPDRIRDQAVRAPSFVSKEDTRFWHRALHDQGWIAPNWPKAQGGTGWNITQKHIYAEEYQAAHAPRLSSFGLTMVGPVIYTFGTEAQKARHLPGILSGDVFWCQGYSEPGSGSDLASLRTRAVLDGDDYVINGQKIWTSHAHHADWIFVLVRTDSAVKQQQGITFLLVDMTTPGLTVRPIVSIDGNHYLNEVFFVDVRVPVANRIGEENKGWTYAKFLLGHERTGIAGVAKSKAKAERLRANLARANLERGGLGDDPDARRRLAEIEVKLTGLEFTQLRALSREQTGLGVGPEASLLKIGGTEVEQALNEMLVDCLGYYAGPFETASSLRVDSNQESVVAPHGRGLMTEHLLRRAASIYGGTNEIQRNIIAKRVLDL